MKKRIQLADDDAGIREILVRVLESEQYEVVIAGTGREAVAEFAANPPIECAPVLEFILLQA
jgi:CheY-like chemotaxis protein